MIAGERRRRESAIARDDDTDLVVKLALDVTTGATTGCAKICLEPVATRSDALERVDQGSEVAVDVLCSLAPVGAESFWVCATTLLERFHSLDHHCVLCRLRVVLTFDPYLVHRRVKVTVIEPLLERRLPRASHNELLRKGVSCIPRNRERYVAWVEPYRPTSEVSVSVRDDSERCVVETAADAVLESALDVPL